MLILLGLLTRTLDKRGTPTWGECPWDTWCWQSRSTGDNEYISDAASCVPQQALLLQGWQSTQSIMISSVTACYVGNQAFWHTCRESGSLSRTKYLNVALSIPPWISMTSNTAHQRRGNHRSARILARSSSRRCLWHQHEIQVDLASNRLSTLLTSWDDLGSTEFNLS